MSLRLGETANVLVVLKTDFRLPNIPFNEMEEIVSYNPWNNENLLDIHEIIHDLTNIDLKIDLYISEIFDAAEITWFTENDSNKYIIAQAKALVKNFCYCLINLYNDLGLYRNNILTYIYTIENNSMYSQRYYYLLFKDNEFNCTIA